MKKKILFAAILIISALLGCTKEKQEFQIVIPQELDNEPKAIVMKAWPAVKRACPGLDRYSDMITFDGIETSISAGMDKWLEETGHKEKEGKVTIRFKVSEESKNPTIYRAYGHTCFLEISRNGKYLTIPKEPCASLCLDRNVEREIEPIPLY